MEVGMQGRESVRESQNLESIMTDGRGQQRQMMHTTGAELAVFDSVKEGTWSLEEVPDNPY